MSFRIGNRLILGICIALALMLGLSAQVGATPVEDAKIVINIPSRTLWLYSGRRIVKYYPVGVGRHGFPTPLGRYQVTRKVINPGWENPYKPSGSVRVKPGKGNPLGTRWIGFKPHNGGEYGIHGTNQPRSVGRLSSHGCVRMKISDVEDLFEQVTVGTPVEVTYQQVLLRPEGDRLRVVVYPDWFCKGRPTA
jgi:L,D-transpeptidase ErfK/SrfK